MVSEPRMGEEPQVHSLETALCAMGSAAVPEGFERRLKSFEEMVEAVAAIPEERLDQLADEVDDRVRLGKDAYDLGVAYLERGDLERAELWLRRADRYGARSAEPKLADLDELRLAFAEIRSSYPIPRLPAADSRAADNPVSTDEALEVVNDAYAEAQRVISEAEHKAAEIIAAARIQARHNTPTVSTMAERFRRLLADRFEADRDNDAPTRSWRLDYSQGMPAIDVVPTLRSDSSTDAGHGDRRLSVVRFADAVGKTHRDGQLCADLAGDWRIVLYVMAGAGQKTGSVPLTGSYHRSTRISRRRRPDLDLMCFLNTSMSLFEFFWESDPDEHDVLMQSRNHLMHGHSSRCAPICGELLGKHQATGWLLVEGLSEAALFERFVEQLGQRLHEHPRARRLREEKGILLPA